MSAPAEAAPAPLPEEDTPIARAEALKSEGNHAFVAKEYPRAVEIYTQAIALDAANHLLFGNRSAAYYFLGQYEAALEDARRSVTLDPTWVKGHIRAAQALTSLHRYAEALAQLKEAARVEPGSKLVAKAQSDAIASAREYDSTHPIDSIAHWSEVFMRIGDARHRLVCLAEFWNQSSPKERLRVFRNFLSTVPVLGADVKADAFVEDVMVDLPMQNYSDISAPELWKAFYAALPTEEKVSLFQTTWDLCSDDERRLIVRDIQAYFAPPE